MGEALSSTRPNKETRRHRRIAASAAALALASVAGLSAACTAASSAPNKPINVASIARHDIPTALPSGVKLQEANVVSMITTSCAQKVTSSKFGTLCANASHGTPNALYSGVNLGSGRIVTAGHVFAPNAQTGEPARHDTNCGDNYAITPDKTSAQVNGGKMAYNYEHASDFDAPGDIAFIQLNNGLLTATHSSLLAHGTTVAGTSPKPGDVLFAITWQSLSNTSTHTPVSAEGYNKPTEFPVIDLGENSNGVLFLASGYKTYSEGHEAAKAGADGDSGAGLFNENGQLVAILDGSSPPITADQLKQSTGTIATGLPSTGVTERATAVTPSLLDSLSGSADLSNVCMVG